MHRTRVIDTMLWKCGYILVAVVSMAVCEMVEPSCSLYDRDYKILEKIATVVAQQKVLEDTVTRQQGIIHDLQQQTQGCTKAIDESSVDQTTQPPIVGSGVGYNFKDLLAQSTCTAMMSEGGHAYAVRRTCSTLTVPCQEICSQLSLKCFNSLHVYGPGYREGTRLAMYRYNSCGGSFCGPNYCCCNGS